MASYLGRNVNLALLVIIIGVIIVMVGTTVFFQRGLQNRTQAYEQTSGTLSECQVALSSYQDKYTAAQKLVNQTSADIGKYNQLYDQKTKELLDTQTQLGDMTRQRDFERLQKEKFKEFYETAQRQNSQLNASVQALENEVDDLEEKVDDLRDDLRACQEQ